MKTQSGAWLSGGAGVPETLTFSTRPTKSWEGWRPACAREGSARGAGIRDSTGDGSILDSETRPGPGLMGGVCVWFAASEHCGVPRAPSGLLGNEETSVSRAETSLGAGPALSSPALITRSPALVESRGRGGCSSAHPSISSLFFAVLNSFLTFSMPWLLLLLLLCVCQPGELR